MGEIYLTVTPGVVPAAERVLTPQTEPDRGVTHGRSQGMDGIRELLAIARDHGLVPGHFRGLLHIAIGRKVARNDGSVISAGLTWREVAALLKLLRFDRELVREWGADPDALAPRDRERFWYSAIALAKVDSAQAVTEAERLIGPLKDLGFIVGAAPTSHVPPPPAREPTPPTPPAESHTKDEKSTKKKKKP